LNQAGSGAGAARLMSGDLKIYHDLEKKIACLKGKEAALLFGSGYMTNSGIIPALAGRHDVIFSDRLNHASIYDGCRLARAKLHRFHHNDLNHLEELLRRHRGKGQALIVVESIYSMDGDFCPLRELAALKERYDCLLMVDEAHATGLYGSNGSGLIEEEGVTDQVDIAMGTFGKALGSYGAYIAASRNMVGYLINRARSFIYSTALPPAVIGASTAAVDIIQAEPQLRRELHGKALLFKETLKKGGLDHLGPSQIIPVLVGDSDKAMDMAASLRKEGIFTTAVRPPTVPPGTARLRFSITLHLSDDDILRCARLLLRTLKL
ncbi:MAG: aminotransferase class I/II-fold pyridoxal phosphate-dependent enzyme, partial [Desulfobulbaceae bacterium]|nr:aminotransferase class I/II-fold pyridoxal phosphate-dependent enzyme [Desulfobulbaceae bacterium]